MGMYCTADLQQRKQTSWSILWLVSGPDLIISTTLKNNLLHLPCDLDPLQNLMNESPVSMSPSAAEAEMRKRGEGGRLCPKHFVPKQNVWGIKVEFYRLRFSENYRLLLWELLKLSDPTVCLTQTETTTFSLSLSDLKFRKSLNGLQRPEDTQHPQRLDGLDVPGFVVPVYKHTLIISSFIVKITWIVHELLNFLLQDVSSDIFYQRCVIFHI